MAKRSTKTCKECQESKTRNSFTRDGRTVDGLRKVCEDCRQASQERRTASVAAPAAEETREQQNDAQTAAEPFYGATPHEIERTRNLSDPRKTFDDMAEGMWPGYPIWNFPAPFEEFTLTQEQQESLPGMVIALMRRDIEGYRFMLAQVCETLEEALTMNSAITEHLITFLVVAEKKDAVIQLHENSISRQFASRA